MLFTTLSLITVGSAHAQPATSEEAPDPCAAPLFCLAPTVCRCEVDGHVVTVRIDSDGDGVFDARTVRRLDADGYPRSERTYLGAAGEPVHCHRYRYANGRLVRESSDAECDGATDWRASYRFAADGSPLAEMFDADGDGHIDSHVRWLYDRRGGLERVEYRYAEDDDLADTNCRYDPPCPPPYNSCWDAQICWEDARLEPQSLDAISLADRDLIVCGPEPYCVDWQSVCGCDDSGRVVYRATDEDRDGVVDEYRWRVYDPDGGYVESTDIGADGEVEVHNHFDADGAVVEAWWDDDVDGVNDRGMVYRRGLSGRIDVADTFVGGVLMRRATYERDERGNLVREEADRGADGQPEWIWTGEYDVADRLVAESWDCDGDGTAEASASYAHADDGATVASGQPGFHCSRLEYRPATSHDTSVDFPNRWPGP